MNNGNRELNLAELECVTGAVHGHSELTINMFGGSLTLGTDTYGGKTTTYMTWTGSNGNTVTSKPEPIVPG
jgi:hypothetical protein